MVSEPILFIMNLTCVEGCFFRCGIMTIVIISEVLPFDCKVGGNSYLIITNSWSRWNQILFASKPHTLWMYYFVLAIEYVLLTIL